jgi:hypothetical protein
MSHNSFDDAVLSRFESPSASATNDNAISINSLSHDDFKNYDTAKRYDPISGVATMAELYSEKLPGLIQEKLPGLSFKPTDNFDRFPDNHIGIIELKPAFDKPPFDLKPRPGSLIDIDRGFDRPSRYPLPVEQLTPTGEGALQQLNERITAQAVKKVQDSMTPQEKHQLNKDAEKYSEEMRKYEEQMSREMMMKHFRRPEDWPSPPEKPQSMVKYEQAIDKEIEKIVRRLQA